MKNLPLDRILCTNGFQDRVRPEALPAAAVTRLAAERTNGWAEIDIGAFSTELLANGHATLVYQVLVPSPTGSYAGRECRDMVCTANTQSRVLETQLWEPYTGSTSRHSNTDTARSDHVFRGLSIHYTYSVTSQSSC